MRLLQLMNIENQGRIRNRKNILNGKIFYFYIDST